MISFNLFSILNKFISSAFTIFRISSKENINHSSSQIQRPGKDSTFSQDSNDVPICPYCEKLQDAWPERRKKKCAHCKKTMHVRYKSITKERGTGNLILDDRILVNEETAWVYDWILDLYDFGYSINKFEKKQQTYAKKHGMPLSNRDAVWSILNELLNNYTRRANSPKVYTLHFLMAKFIKENGEDPFIQLREQGKTRLLQLRNENCSQVKICLSKRKDDPVPCEICVALENKVYNIDQAIDELPVPPKECKNKYCCTYYGQIFES